MGLIPDLPASKCLTTFLTCPYLSFPICQVGMMMHSMTELLQRPHAHGDAGEALRGLQSLELATSLLTSRSSL